MNTHRQTNGQRRAMMSSSTRPQHHPPSWARLLLVLAGLAALALLVSRLFPRAKPAIPEQAAQHSANSYHPVAAVPAVQKATGVTLGLRPGDRLVYDYQQEHTIEIQGSGFGGIKKGATNQSVSMHTVQTGELAVNVYHENDKGWTVGFSLENASIRVSSGQRVAPPDGSEAGLRAEILAFVEKSGRIARMTAQTNTSAEVLNHWRNILSRWQTILESDPSTR